MEDYIYTFLKSQFKGEYINSNEFIVKSNNGNFGLYELCGTTSYIFGCKVNEIFSICEKFYNEEKANTDVNPF